MTPTPALSAERLDAILAEAADYIDSDRDEVDAGQFAEEVAEHILALIAAARHAEALAGALEPFRRAHAAFVEAFSNFQIVGNTAADRRASESEREATAEGAAFDILADVTFDELENANAALSAYRGGSDE